MSTNRRAATILGALFLIAMVTSLGGGIWLESILPAPDYVTTASENEAQVLIAVLLELINCAAVVGIAAMLFPILKKHSDALAVGYTGFRVIEAAVLAVAAIVPLVLVALSQEYLAAGASDAAQYLTWGALVSEARARLTGLLTPVFFSLGALLLYASLYRTKLVPRFISVWGLIAVALMLPWNLVASFGVTFEAEMILVLPMILNEVFLGIWLIVKGFSPSAAPSPSAR